MEEKVMSGGSAGNIRVADRCYQYIQENGDKTVSELKDYLNTFPRGVTSEQLANVLRCSPLFKVSDTTTITYGAAGGLSAKKSKVGGNSWGSAFHYTNEKNTVTQLQGSRAKVNVYTIVPIEDIIEKLRGKQHLVRKRWPKVLKDAMKKEGLI